jgi:hypothetical protein
MWFDLFIRKGQLPLLLRQFALAHFAVVVCPPHCSRRDDSFCSGFWRSTRWDPMVNRQRPYTLCAAAEIQWTSQLGVECLPVVFWRRKILKMLVVVIRFTIISKMTLAAHFDTAETSITWERPSPLPRHDDNGNCCNTVPLLQRLYFSARGQDAVSVSPPRCSLFFGYCSILFAVAVALHLVFGNWITFGRQEEWVVCLFLALVTVLLCLHKPR